MTMKMICAAVLAVGGAGYAQAEEVAFSSFFGWQSSGPTYAIGEGHVFSLGEFSGTSTSAEAPESMQTIAWQCPGAFDIDFTTGQATASGFCVATLLSGDAFYLEWTCEEALSGTGSGPMPLGEAGCIGEGTIVGGTGELAGITGGNSFTAHTVLFHPDGKGSGYTENDWRIAMP